MIFIHIPKTAGVSLSSAVYETQVGHLRLLDYQRADENKYRRYFKFAFVRNPWDRIVSAYAYLAKGGMPEYRYDRAFKKKVIDPCGSFEVFVMDWLNEKTLYLHAHFIPQYRFITDREGEVGLNFLGRFEHLQRDFEIVCRRLKIRRETERVNVTEHPHYSEYYTRKEMIDKIGRLYKRDVSLFGYEF